MEKKKKKDEEDFIEQRNIVKMENRNKMKEKEKRKKNFIQYIIANLNFFFPVYFCISMLVNEYIISK